VSNSCAARLGQQATAAAACLSYGHHDVVHSTWAINHMLMCWQLHDMKGLPHN
jgi:hypothetical protein